MSIKANILILDDEEGIREILEDLLVDLGASVDTCGNGEDALALMKEKDFDVVISDMRMPNLSGEKFLEKLIENDLVPKKFFFITGGGAYDIENQELLPKIAGVIEKPFRDEAIDELLSDFKV